jgi:hypothetical protein
MSDELVPLGAIPSFCHSRESGNPDYMYDNCPQLSSFGQSRRLSYISGSSGQVPTGYCGPDDDNQVDWIAPSPNGILRTGQACHPFRTASNDWFFVKPVNLRNKKRIP